MEASNKLREYLKKNSMTRLEFAEKSGLSKSLIDKILSRKHYDVRQSTMQIFYDCTGGYITFDDWQCCAKL